MITLQKDGAGLVDFIIQFATGGFRAFDIIMDFHAVEDHRDAIADDGGFCGLPFGSRAGDKFIRRFEVINGTIPTEGGGSAAIIAEDLYLVPAAQVEAAVGVIGDLVLEPDGKIPKFFVGHQISAVFAFFDFIGEDAIFNGPTIVTLRITQMPTREVLAIKQGAKIFVLGSSRAKSKCEQDKEESRGGSQFHKRLMVEFEELFKLRTKAAGKGSSDFASGSAR
jgi:hypothetical protein